MAGTAPPLAVRKLDPIGARALGIRPGGALLARPDGIPVAWWPQVADAPSALAGAVDGVVTAGRHPV